MVITPFLTIQNQLKILHWQTKSFSEHKALGKAYDSLDPLIDQFVEVYFAKYGNINAKDTFKINLINYGDRPCKEMIEDFVNSVENIRNNLSENDTELLNISDEILAVLQQTKYLLRLT